MSLREELSQIVAHYNPVVDTLSFTECTQQINELKRLIALAEGAIASRRPRPPQPEQSGIYVPGQNTAAFHKQTRERRRY